MKSHSRRGLAWIHIIATAEPFVQLVALTSFSTLRCGTYRSSKLTLDLPIWKAFENTNTLVRLGIEVSSEMPPP